MPVAERADVRPCQRVDCQLWGVDVRGAGLGEGGRRGKGGGGALCAADAWARNDSRRAA